ncbi:translocation/assembly module TamB domain-containing protein [Mesorhizobium koreense]|uniref:translocation/assembly module TamB domain-containing protein n=1 Tax=Mesorhizobium koreense TaxID=3074855 RepID=UPI00287BA81A|nr:translocation/assembly module TamB domain-containing protein [Mesorhizobium sp. WR6]
MRRILVAIALLLTIFPAFAQDKAEAEKSYFLQYVEQKLSTPNRKISISGISGVLSSSATIGEITIADRQGVWLKIVNASIDWNRAALLLGRLDVNKLAAEEIDMLRKPLPEKGVPAPESSSFQLPELPVSIKLRELSVAKITFGESVFGLGSQLKLSGRVDLADGSLDTALDINRLDGPGGEFKLAAKYANETKKLDLDLSLAEPANGIVANLLNIEGKPPVDMTLKGSGPLDKLDLALTLDADHQRVLTGTTNIRRSDGGYGFSAKLGGPIAKLVPPQFRDFFGADTNLLADGVVKDSGGVILDRLNLASNALKLDGSLETTSDGFLRRLKLDASIADPTGKTVLLPVSGAQTTIENAKLAVAFGDDPDQKWTGSLDIAGLTSPTFASENIALDMGGVAENMDQPASRHISFSTKGKASGITSKRPDVAKALGKEIDLDIQGDWRAGKPVELSKALLSGNGLSLSIAGEIAESVFNGTIDVDASSIAPFSGLADRQLSGSMKLAAKGQLKPLSGGFDMVLDGKTMDLTIDSPSADSLLGGVTSITGRVARDETGLTADKLRIENQQLTLTADGKFATGKADFGFDFTLADLALAAKQASGKLTASGRAKGDNGRIALAFKAEVPDGTLAEKKLAGAVMNFDGILQNGNLSGKLDGNATLDNAPVSLASDIALADGEKRLTGLSFTAGATRLSGDVTQSATGLLDGKLSLASTDISTAAALFLQEASGAAHADIALSNTEGKQAADISARLDGVTVGENRIGQAQLNAAIADLFGVPAVNGSAKATDLTVAKIEVTRLDANANRNGDATKFDATANLKNGTDAAVAGSLAPENDGYRLRLTQTDLKQGKLSVALAEPASILVQGQNLAIDSLSLNTGGGRIDAKGKVADKLDLAVTIHALPLAIANAIRPDLQAGGTIDGTANVSGERANPDINFSLQGKGLTAAALREAGLSTVSVDAKGNSSGKTLQLDANVTSPEGLRAVAKGNVPLDDEGRIAMNVDLDAFPLAALNAVAKGQNLGGKLSASAKVGGTLADPTADFTIDGNRVSAAPLENAGVTYLDVKAAGRYEGKAITLRSATANSPQGLSISASGRVPLSGSGLGVSIDGKAPLSLANRLLADRGAQASGILALNAKVSGSIRKPLINGSFSTSGAQFVDPETNLRLGDIAVNGSIAGETVTLRSVTASLGKGGKMTVTGTISTNAAANFPANIRIVLDNARYADGNMVVARLNGNIAVTGPLTRDPLISGNIDVERAEISVPDTLGGGAAGIDVKHLNAPPKVAATLARAHANDGTPVPTGRPSVAKLDLTVRAPARIFVRGRGLDVELGGQIKLTGPVTGIRPVGGFKLIRGRLSIIGQRIVFTEGEVTLIGDLDPMVHLVATSEGTDITVFVTVTGRASDPKVVFSSQPELPQDEVLARLIFNRGINDLSAFQIAQLAAAVAELAGGSNTSLLGNLRKATGLDDLDVVTNEKGQTAVRAGRYIQDNIYLGVEAGAQGDTKGTVNLDITKDLKAKGALGTTDSSMGLFYEKDY